MKKEYVKPETLTMECQVEKILAVSSDSLRITDQGADDEFEVLSRDNRWNSSSLWN